MIDPDWAHLGAVVDALVAAGNATSLVGFQPTQGGWNCAMEQPLDLDILRPLIAADPYPLEFAPDQDTLWCRHCWAAIIGPSGLPASR